MGRQRKSLVKASAKQKQSVEVHVHVDNSQSKKKKKYRKKSASTESAPIIVRPIYQSILAPQSMPTHNTWPPNVYETNSQVQRQNLQNELNHEQSILSLKYPQHSEVIHQTAQGLRESLGLNHLVRGRETIPLTPITTPMNTPIIASLPFVPSSFDSEEMMTPRVDTNEFTTYKNELFEAPSVPTHETPKMSSAFKAHPINHMAESVESDRNLGFEHHGVAQREHTSVKKEKLKHEYYNLYNKYEEVKIPSSDSQKKERINVKEQIIAFAKTLPNLNPDLHVMLQKTSGINIANLTAKLNTHFNH